MKVEFCPKCGRKMEYVVEEGGVVAKCPKCGFIRKVSLQHTHERYKTEQKVVVVEEEFTPMPTVNVECPRCGFREAYAWTVQTRSGDESETQFFKCKKFGYTWRLYA